MVKEKQSFRVGKKTFDRKQLEKLFGSFIWPKFKLLTSKIIINKPYLKGYLLWPQFTYVGDNISLKI
jgi:hypothetical protein